MNYDSIMTVKEIISLCIIVFSVLICGYMIARSYSNEYILSDMDFDGLFGEIKTILIKCTGWKCVFQPVRLKKLIARYGGTDKLLSRMNDEVFMMEAEYDVEKHCVRANDILEIYKAIETVSGKIQEPEKNDVYLKDEWKTELGCLYLLKNVEIKQFIEERAGLKKQDTEKPREFSNTEFLTGILKKYRREQECNGYMPDIKYYGNTAFYLECMIDLERKNIYE